MTNVKWPKVLPELTPAQQRISNEHMQHWHEVVIKKNVLLQRYDVFNHGYVVNNAPKDFISTLEIGAGLGEHLYYERLSDLQKKNYVALELRENMADKIRQHHPDVITHVGDCQKQLSFESQSFDRIIAIHVLEHLPDLPRAIAEMHRLCKKDGVFSIVIPCDPGMLYELGRTFTAKRIFEKRYNQPYKWLIEREHINTPKEIFEELDHYFIKKHKSYFPFKIPMINFNLCIGMTFQPRII